MENMEELIDLLVKDESPSQISDAIKDVLFAKSAERIEGAIIFFTLIFIWTSEKNKALGGVLWNRP